jgi:hypothetical protein
MNDDEMKLWIRRIAKERKNLKSARHLALSEDNELVGVHGEWKIHKFFGVPFTPRSDRIYGDGGIDIQVPLLVDGRVRTFDIDVKAFRKPGHLLVKEETEIHDCTIYVLGKYVDAMEEVTELLGWEWGLLVRRAPITDKLGGHRGHAIKRGKLREMDELAERYFAAKRAA